ITERVQSRYSDLADLLQCLAMHNQWLNLAACSACKRSSNGLSDCACNSFKLALCCDGVACWDLLRDCSNANTSAKGTADVSTGDESALHELPPPGLGHERGPCGVLEPLGEGRESRTFAILGIGHQLRDRIVLLVEVILLDKLRVGRLAKERQLALP